MQFTPQEIKLVERLRKRERCWPRTRWVLLAAAAFVFVVYAYVLAQLVDGLQSNTFSEIPGAMALIVAVFWPKCLLGFCIGFYLVGLAIRDWHGNVERMLLLRLLDEQQKKTG
jgi:hypothetical protein